MSDRVEMDDLLEAIDWLRLNDNDFKDDRGVTKAQSCKRVADALERECVRRITRRHSRRKNK
ncbi:hypothetical protein TH5_01310 [Thalassospira xianhensis MCCC 1A02616]|uniref:Uncharacterized protein n=1 Tax=Thalassospira xianhensis MCCC 1A02616 TaxID=1177929 RepID=A0A367UKS7_9PROT|nr:hypothetical protein [Thalassospira xianhensis]RCK07732.1 hypothetical protein TH5_01310 [Thalassospira xianhensis MCCC 1A02616]